MELLCTASRCCHFQVSRLYFSRHFIFFGVESSEHPRHEETIGKANLLFLFLLISINFYKTVGSTSVLVQVLAGDTACGYTLKDTYKHRGKVYMKVAARGTYMFALFFLFFFGVYISNPYYFYPLIDVLMNGQRQPTTRKTGMTEVLEHQASILAVRIT